MLPSHIFFVLWLVKIYCGTAWLRATWTTLWTTWTTSTLLLFSLRCPNAFLVGSWTSIYHLVTASRASTCHMRSSWLSWRVSWRTRLRVLKIIKIVVSNGMKSVITNLCFTWRWFRSTKYVSTLVDVSFLDIHLNIVLSNFNAHLVTICRKRCGLLRSWCRSTWISSFIGSWYCTWSCATVSKPDHVTCGSRKETIVSNWSKSWSECRLISYSSTLINLSSINVHYNGLKINESVCLHLFLIIISFNLNIQTF